MVNAVQLYHHLTCITNCISIYLYSLCWSRNLDGFGSVEISSMKASKSRGACVFFVSQYSNVKICLIERFPHSLNIKYVLNIRVHIVTCQPSPFIYATTDILCALFRYPSPAESASRGYQEPKDAQGTAYAM